MVSNSNFLTIWSKKQSACICRKKCCGLTLHLLLFHVIQILKSNIWRFIPPASLNTKWKCWGSGCFTSNWKNDRHFFYICLSEYDLKSRVLLITIMTATSRANILEFYFNWRWKLKEFLSFIQVLCILSIHQGFIKCSVSTRNTKDWSKIL